MSVHPTSRPAVTVAAVVESRGRFRLVEEETRAGARLNQPAKHLEPAATLAAAAVRETREKTGWDVSIESLLGIYRSDSPVMGQTFVRITFAQSRACTIRNAGSTPASVRCGCPIPRLPQVATSTAALSSCAPMIFVAAGDGRSTS